MIAIQGGSAVIFCPLLVSQHPYALQSCSGGVKGTVTVTGPSDFVPRKKITVLAISEGPLSV